MTQLWKDSTVIPVTVISVTPNTVSMIRTKERDAYEATQLSLGKKTKKEFRIHASRLTLHDTSFKVGDAIAVDTFKEGDRVRVSGLSKGRGFQGVVKRHGFGGGPKTHGQKNRFRAPGSIGSTAFQRVVKGRRMAGRMGMERVTVKNLTVISIDTEKNLLYLKGAIPGSRGTLVEIVKK